MGCKAGGWRGRFRVIALGRGGSDVAVAEAAVVSKITAGGARRWDEEMWSLGGRLWGLGVVMAFEIHNRG